MHENDSSDTPLSNKGGAGLYIHIPFCVTRCAYCSFYSETSLSLASDWLDALQKEAHIYKDGFGPFSSLYLGGGTPTCLKASQLTSLMDCVLRCFRFSDNPETTMEANPDDITADKLRLLAALGINRISLGVQSFDDTELIYLGRRHTVAQAEQALESIRACGFTNVGIDLIYGLPGQTKAAWTDTLKRAVDFRPEHISCYELTIEKATLFNRLMEAGTLRGLGEEDGRGFFLLTSGLLEESGYLHYEVSNFSRGEQYCCSHNLGYWRHAPYLGLGPSAHSFRNRTRWWNIDSVETYCRMLARGGTPIAGHESLSPEQYRLESLYLGFRTIKGVDIELVRQRTGTNPVLKELEKSGLVRLAGDRVIPTKQGLVVADSLPLLFCD